MKNYHSLLGICITMYIMAVNRLSARTAIKCILHSKEVNLHETLTVGNSREKTGNPFLILYNHCINMCMCDKIGVILM